MGRSPKPINRHRLDGTFRRDRHARPDQSEPRPGAPEPPETLHGEGRAEWERMVDRLTEAKTSRSGATVPDGDRTPTACRPRGPRGTAAGLEAPSARRSVGRGPLPSEGRHVKGGTPLEAFVDRGVVPALVERFLRELSRRESSAARSRDAEPSASQRYHDSL